MSERLHKLILTIHSFLSRYYDVLDIPEPTNFVLENCGSLGLGGQVLIKESPDGLEVGIQFGSELDAHVQHESCVIGPHALGVVVEEVSHFLAIMQAASNQTVLSPLDFEVLGEIDRFIVFAHAQDVLGPLDIACSAAWPDPGSLSGLCTLQFAHRSFSCGPELTATYLKAESVALAHLQKAFGPRWQNTKLDPRTLDPVARGYLSNLRQAVTTQGQSVRIFLECA